MANPLSIYTKNIESFDHWEDIPLENRDSIDSKPSLLQKTSDCAQKNLAQQKVCNNNPNLKEKVALKHTTTHVRQPEDALPFSKDPLLDSFPLFEKPSAQTQHKEPVAPHSEKKPPSRTASNEMSFLSLDRNFLPNKSSRWTLETSPKNTTSPKGFDDTSYENTVSSQCTHLKPIKNTKQQQKNHTDTKKRHQNFVVIQLGTAVSIPSNLGLKNDQGFLKKITESINTPKIIRSDQDVISRWQRIEDSKESLNKIRSFIQIRDNMPYYSYKNQSLENLRSAWIRHAFHNFSYLIHPNFQKFFICNYDFDNPEEIKNKLESTKKDENKVKYLFLGSIKNKNSGDIFFGQFEYLGEIFNKQKNGLNVSFYHKYLKLRFEHCYLNTIGFNAKEFANSKPTFCELKENKYIHCNEFFIIDTPREKITLYNKDLLPPFSRQNFKDIK